MDLLQDAANGAQPIYNYLKDLPSLGPADPILPLDHRRNLPGAEGASMPAAAVPLYSFCHHHVQGRKSRRRSADDVGARRDTTRRASGIFIKRQSARNKDWRRSSTDHRVAQSENMYTGDSRSTCLPQD
jgi:hypothetical protein